MRQAAKSAVARAFSTSLVANTKSTTPPSVVDERFASDDVFSIQSQANSDGSVFERAVRRGSHRGSGESNEVHDVDAYHDDLSGTEFDLTTVTDDLRTSPPPGKQPKRKLLSFGWFQRKRFKTRAVFRLVPRRERATRLRESMMNAWDMGKYDAWMCGVCGNAFSSLEAADRHEDYHIRELVTDLGWAGDQKDDDLLTTSMASIATFERDNRIQQTTVDGDKPVRKQEKSAVFAGSKVTFEETHNSVLTLNAWKAPRQSLMDFPDDTLIPSPLFGNKQRQTPRKSNLSKVPTLHDEKEDDDLLMPDYMRQCIMLADEALVDVCKRAEFLILTRQEIEAERELCLLAKDKSYYDQIAERSTARTANPTNRFRLVTM
jgi:hypothetical protein